MERNLDTYHLLVPLYSGFTFIRVEGRYRFTRRVVDGNKPNDVCRRPQSRLQRKFFRIRSSFFPLTSRNQDKPLYRQIPSKPRPQPYPTPSSSISHTHTQYTFFSSFESEFQNRHKSYFCATDDRKAKHKIFHAVALVPSFPPSPFP